MEALFKGVQAMASRWVKLKELLVEIVRGLGN